MADESSNDLKVVVGKDRSSQGSRRRKAVPPPTIEEEHESETERGVLIKEKPCGIASKI